MADHKSYLGDSVYAHFDGWAVTLTTENDVLGDPSNLIVLEPQVMQILIRWYDFVTTTGEKDEPAT